MKPPESLQANGREPHPQTPAPPVEVRPLPTQQGLVLTPAMFADVSDRSGRYQQGLPLGVETPFPGLTKILGGGFQAGQVYILGAPPGCGKSSLAARFARHLSEIGGRALYLAYEVSPAACMLRLLADVSGVPLNDIQDGRTDPEGLKAEFSAAMQRASQGLSFVDATLGSPSSGEITATVDLVMRDGVDKYSRLLIVDYLQLAARKALKDDREKDFRARVAMFSNELASTARNVEVPVPVLALASLARSKYEESKDISAFKEAGDIESDADVCMLIGLENGTKWEEVRGKDIWNLELSVLKNRHGRTGTVRLEFNRPLQRFTER